MSQQNGGDVRECVIPVTNGEKCVLTFSQRSLLAVLQLPSRQSLGKWDLYIFVKNHEEWEDLTPKRRYIEKSKVLESFDYSTLSSITEFYSMREMLKRSTTLIEVENYINQHADDIN
jgi:hypothetical protein